MNGTRWQGLAFVLCFPSLPVAGSFAYLVMRLVDEGVMDLDTPVPGMGHRFNG